MKVCILATTYPRFKGDTVPQFVHGFAVALREAGTHVTVVAPHDRKTAAHEIVDGVEIHRFHYWWPRSFQGLCYGAGIPSNVRRRRWLAIQLLALEAAFLAAALRYGTGADIYNPHWSFAALPTIFAAQIAHKPVVTHAYSAEFVPRTLRPINRFIIKNSAGVISISSYAHALVEQAGSTPLHEVMGFGVNTEKIATIDFDVAAFRSGIGVEPDEFLVFAVGRLVERKGYHVLIEAVADLVRQGMKVRLLLAGTGPLYDPLLAQIKATGITDEAHMLGFISDDQLRCYIKAADALVMPSVRDRTGDTEGLGIPLLEGMANGTPVIGTNVGGIVDIVINEKTGLLVPPDDARALAEALQRLHRDSALRHQMVQEGLELVSSAFSWQEIARRTLAVFETALSLNK